MALLHDLILFILLVQYSRHYYTQWPQYGRYGYLWYGIDPWFMANVFDGKQGPTESRYILKSKRRDSRHFRVI